MYYTGPEMPTLILPMVSHLYSGHRPEMPTIILAMVSHLDSVHRHEMPTLILPLVSHLDCGHSVCPVFTLLGHLTHRRQPTEGLWRDTGGDTWWLSGTTLQQESILAQTFQRSVTQCFEATLKEQQIVN